MFCPFFAFFLRLRSSCDFFFFSGFDLFIVGLGQGLLSYSSEGLWIVFGWLVWAGLDFAGFDGGRF